MKRNFNIALDCVSSIDKLKLCCIMPSAEPTIITANPPACPPLSNCSLSMEDCTHGFVVDHHGCEYCSCRLGQYISNYIIRHEARFRVFSPIRLYVDYSEKTVPKSIKITFLSMIGPNFLVILLMIRYSIMVAIVGTDQ